VFVFLHTTPKFPQPNRREPFFFPFITITEVNGAQELLPDMVQIDDKYFKSAMDEMRELLNWLVVINKEYDVTPKDASATKRRVEKVVRFLEKGMK